MSSVEAKRTRRPAARHHQVVMAAAEERLMIMESCSDPELIRLHGIRLRELFEELRKSVEKSETE